MQRIFHLFTLLLFISQAYSLAGFGLNLNQTIFGVDGVDNSIDNVGSYGYKKMSGGNGLGGYLYIDAIPFIDIDLEFSGFGTTYNYSVTIAQTTTSYSLPFGSLDLRTGRRCPMKKQRTGTPFTTTDYIDSSIAIKVGEHSIFW